MTNGTPSASLRDALLPEEAGYWEGAILMGAAMVVGAIILVVGSAWAFALAWASEHFANA